MKKYLLIAIAIFLFKTSFSQYQPLPMQNAYWVCSGAYDLLSNPIPIQYMYYTDGDTIINSTTYVKIKKTEDPPVNNIYIYATFTGVIRQDTLNKKIYVIPTDSTSEKLLYDFSLQVGDTVLSFLNGNCPTTVTISNIDSILINGNYHKRFYLQNACSGIQIYFIEGIGSNFGLLYPNNTGNISNLDCVKINGQTYYPSNMSPCNLITSTDNIQLESSINIYLNHTTDKINIEFTRFDNSAALLTVYNYFGQEIKKQTTNSNQTQINISELPTGIYLVTVTQNNKTINKKIIKS